MTHNMNLMLTELSKKLGVSLSLSQGATVFSDHNGHEFWFESSEGSELIIIHTALKHYSVSNASVADKTKWLLLNSRPDLMKGVWISLHAPTDTVRLNVAAAVGFVDANILEIIVHNLVELAAHVPSYTTSSDMLN